MTSTTQKSPYTFIKLLHETFTLRLQKEPGYSLRKYARDLNISASTLSRLFNGRLQLTPPMFEKILEQLQLTPCDIKHHRELYNQERTKHRGRLYAIDRQNPRIVDQLRFLMEVDHLTVLRFITIEKSIKYDLADLEEKTSVAGDKVQEIIDRLLRLGLVTVKDSHILMSPPHHYPNRVLLLQPDQKTRQLVLTIEINFVPALAHEIENFLKQINNLSPSPEDLTSSAVRCLNLKPVKIVTE